MKLGKSIILMIYVYLFMCVSVCATCAWVPAEARRGAWSSWGTQGGCGELDHSHSKYS